jgi:7-keto-8-aminopelargonate synthetase-like enzyme
MQVGWTLVTSSRLDVVVIDRGNKTPQLVKAIRRLTGSGGKESEALLRSALPIVILRQLDENAALDAKAALEGAGAQVVLREEKTVPALHPPVVFDVAELMEQFETSLESLSN